MTVNLWRPYGIPLAQYPNDGSFGTVIMGMARQRHDIFVPETCGRRRSRFWKEKMNKEVHGRISAWLKPRLSNDEWQELKAIAGDEKEIESGLRPLEFAPPSPGIMGRASTAE
jgi:hypothetical protein